MHFGWVLAAFSLTYALFQVPAGYLVDRWDVRWTYAGAVAWWSVAGMAAAFSPSLAILMVLRALLGVGESFNWPCALRVTAAILPPADRSLGQRDLQLGGGGGGGADPPDRHPADGPLRLADGVPRRGDPGLRLGRRLARADGRGPSPIAGRRRSGEADGKDADAASSTGPVRTAVVAFGGVAVAAVARGLGVLVGLSAIWWGIAFLMVGLLVAALALPRDGAEGGRLGREPGRGRPAAPVLDPGAGLGLDQRLLALPGELAPHLSQGRPQAGRVRRPDPRPAGVVACQGRPQVPGQRPARRAPVPGGRRGEPRGRRLSRYFAGRGMTP